MPIPENPKIYHIVHWDRLASISSDEALLCDSIVMNTGRGHGTTIGMSSIKQRRLGLQMPNHPGTFVGDYVPFYFCPRSVMLYIIYMANHSELSYRGGQEPIIHLESDLYEVIDWAETNGHWWTFSLSNAAASYTQFRSDLDQLDEINWAAVVSRDWSRSDIKEAKQAEFLVHHYLPWHLVSRIGVISNQIGNRVAAAIGGSDHKPTIEVIRSWYY